MPYGILTLVFYRDTVETGYRITQHAIKACAVRYDEYLFCVTELINFRRNDDIDNFVAN